MDAKLSVILLKAPKDDDPYVEAVAGMGHRAVCLPALSFQYINLRELAGRLATPDKYSCLVITSQNAVEACKQAVNRLSAASEPPPALTGWVGKANFVVGAATGQKALDELGLSCSGADTGSADALADLVIRDLSPSQGCVLYPKTSLKTTNFAEKLRQSGFEVDDIEVYNTLPSADFDESLMTHLRRGAAADVVVFFSPSGVESALPKLRQTVPSFKAVAVGKTTSKALTDAGVVDHLVMAAPRPGALVECLLSMTTPASSL